MPSSYSPRRPAPLVVLLHGAGGNARGGLAPLRDLADEAGLILVAAKSSGPTWDRVGGRFGPDVRTIDLLLHEVFERLAIDRTRLALGGFSDGATYALSLGLTNGDLFTHLIAFSPGGAAPATQRGRPAIFISHGIGDSVLPIDSTSREIVPSLREEGYRVTYREFDGGHAVPREIARDAVAWLLGDRSQSAAASPAPRGS